MKNIMLEKTCSYDKNLPIFTFFKNNKFKTNCLNVWNDSATFFLFICKGNKILKLQFV